MAKQNKYVVHFLTSQGPAGKDEVPVTAAIFVTTQDGQFVDFYSDTRGLSGGGYAASGEVVHRVKAAIVADIVLSGTTA